MTLKKKTEKFLKHTLTLKYKTMLSLRLPLPVKIMCAFIYSDEIVYSRVKKDMARKWGVVDIESDIINFNFTDYYLPEMGKPLFRRFISFKKIIDPRDIIKVKLYCIKIEKKYSVNNKRQVNIDPGYINEAKLVLTTTKDFAHRLYMGKGIYAEVTLCFKDKKFQDLPTTFPDYRTQGYKDIFLLIRTVYRQQMKLQA